jgi:hypothetical protein
VKWVGQPFGVVAWRMALPAWMAMGSMVVFTGILFSPLVSIEKLNALGAVLQMFYLAQAGVVATFFGANAYVRKWSPFRGFWRSPIFKCGVWWPATRTLRVRKIFCVRDQHLFWFHGQVNKKF